MICIQHKFFFVVFICSIDLVISYQFPNFVHMMVFQKHAYFHFFWFSIFNKFSLSYVVFCTNSTVRFTSLCNCRHIFLQFKYRVEMLDTIQVYKDLLRNKFIMSKVHLVSWRLSQTDTVSSHSSCQVWELALLLQITCCHITFRGRDIRGIGWVGVQLVTSSKSDRRKTKYLFRKSKFFCFVNNITK